MKEKHLPQRALEEVNVPREIKSVQAEYCLDGYNQFYQQVLGLIEAHKESGSIKVCAESILTLYK